jgi:hypothetical protein
MLNGARDIDRKTGKTGSTTIEAAIVLPFFLIVLFSLAYIIRIFYTYNTVQAALNETARGAANASYFYYATGLKDYGNMLEELADSAENTLEEQKSTLIEAFANFNDTVSGVGQAAASEDISLDDFLEILEDGQNLSNSYDKLNDLVESISSNPKGELKLFLTIFAEKFTYEARNRVVCLIAKGKLGSELQKRVKTGRDAALSLGIKGGLSGIDFSGSSIFGDSETLDFCVKYYVKASAPFGVIPELKLSNRVKITAWTGGRGKSVRISDEKSDDAGVDEDGGSLWMKMDQDNRYCDRGLEIENLYVGKLLAERKSNGFEAQATSAGYPVIDAYAYDAETDTAEYYDIFTLNPFMKTYSENSSAVAREIKKHGKRLIECDTPEFFKDIDVRAVKRVVVMVVPENSYPEEAVKAAQDYLKKYNVEVLLVKDYGNYTESAEEQEETARNQRETGRDREKQGGKLYGDVEYSI